MSKPREFWIEDKTTLTTLVFDEETKETCQSFYLNAGLLIHVIEKSAADKLADALQCEINMVKHAGYNPHISEKILKEYRGEL